MTTDLELKQQVLSRLELEPKIDPTSVGVTVEDGVVTLQGSVESEAERACTERVVRVMKGVKGLVDDDLRVESAPRERRGDLEIEAASREAIQWLTTAPQENLEVTVSNGWVSVKGQIESQHQAQCVEAVLKDIPGVRGVKTALMVAKPSHAA